MKDFWRYVIQGKEDLHGTASFMGFCERWKLLSSKNRGVVIDGKRKLPLDLSYQGVLIVAPTGMGKTTSYVIPNVLQAHGQSFVITDPSGEILNLTRGYLEKELDYQIQVINPTNLAESDTYNPLESAENFSDAQKVASILIESAFPTASPTDSFWNESAIDLLSVLIRGVVNLDPEEQTLAHLLHLLEMFGAEQDAVNEIMVQSLDEKGYHQFRAFLSQEEKMMNSVLSTAKTALRNLHDPTFADLTASTSLRFESLRESPTALFIQVPESELRYYNFFLSLLYTHLFKFVMQGDHNDKNLQPIFFLFDEAGHVKVPNLATIATTIRKKKCSLSLIVQDLDQLRALYGKEANAIIRGGMVNHLYFGGLDILTCEILERTLGKATVSYSESGYESSLKPAQTRSTQMAKSLMSADEIRRMKNQALLLSSNKPPVLLKLKPWFKQRELVKRSKL